MGQHTNGAAPGDTTREITDRVAELIREIRSTLSRRQPSIERMDETDQMPAELASWLWEQGLLVLALPESEGGVGSVRAMCRVVEELARFSGALALQCVAQATGTLAVSLCGDPAQRFWCFRHANERGLIAFALSETRAGSDARRIETKIADHGDHYEVNGAKWFVTLGGRASHHIVFGRHVVDGEPAGYTAVLVDRDTPGVTVSPRNDLFGMRGVPTTSLILRNVRLPKSCRLGQAGQGFRLAMRTLDHSRPLIGAQAVGLGAAALDAAVRHCRKRAVFGGPLGHLDGVRTMVAEMSVAVDASRLLVERAATAVDAGHPEATAYASGAKFFATDTAMKVALDSLQLMGGFGCFRGRAPERIMRDAKITQIYEGSNQIQRLVVGRHLLGAVARAGGRETDSERSPEGAGDVALDSASTRA